MHWFNYLVYTSRVDFQYILVDICIVVCDYQRDIGHQYRSRKDLGIVLAYRLGCKDTLYLLYTQVSRSESVDFHGILPDNGIEPCGCNRLDRRHSCRIE